MDSYKPFILFGITAIICGLILFKGRELKRYKTLYEKELQNVEAYRANNAGLQDYVRQYQMTMDDIRASKDSVDRKLAEVVDELKIKDKKIEYLQYQTKTIYKTDTIQVQDTIIADNVSLDTIIGDKWYNVKLRLKYPSTVVVSPTFKSEQYVVINTKKEYNKTPSKIFFIRWFQKKHTVVEVNVKERSPYIINKESKFIKIVK